MVSTAREPGRRRAITELVDSERRLYPVGRLDADSTGLILLTNDGELANRLTHPRYGVPKTYRVRLSRPPSDSDLERLRSGVRLEDGPTAPAEVERRGEREIEVTIREGRKRQVRRMAEAVGNEVESLTRIRIGSLELGRAPARGGPAPRGGGGRRALGRFRAMSDELRLWAVRGATKARSNNPDTIVAATEELMRELMARNDLSVDRMVSCIFTSTHDLNAEFPAVAARNLGLDSVPLLCAQEIDVPGAMRSVIRALRPLLRAR